VAGRAARSMMKASVCRVLENERLKDRCHVLKVHAPAIAEACTPGQFVMLRSRSAAWPYLNRPFSIYASDGDSVVEIVYKVVGRATALLAELGGGEKIDMIGPLGKGFSPVDGVAHLIGVAGGIGLPPLAFYCRRYAGACEAITLVIGAATADDLLVPVGLMAEGIEILTLTEDGTKGGCGLATDGLAKVLRTLAVDPAVARVAACGPKPMLSEVHRMAAEAGIACEVSVEEIMACGVGACMSCAVPASGGGYLHACKDGPVVGSSRIDFARWLDV
jgi:dihydroorotate dehydrogenase electron transfer subunit